MALFFTSLADRAVLKLTGRDRHAFLQGVVTNDTSLLSPTKPALYTAFLTPQGKYSFDFFMFEHDESLYLDCEGTQAGELELKLKMYKLRSEVTITNRRSEYVVYTVFGESLEYLPPLPSSDKVLLYRDPRCVQAGFRTLCPVSQAHLLEDFLQEQGYCQGKEEDYIDWCFTLGLPRAPYDLIPGKSIPLECGLDDLQAISWDKGCYLGQELTARTKHRGLVRKRLFPVTLEGEIPSPLASIYLEDKEVGTLYSVKGAKGIAMIRLEVLPVLESNPSAFLTCEKAKVKIHIPEWMQLD